MPNLNTSIQAYNIPKVALAGVNSFDDPKDISDQETVDALNVVYDNGYEEPRMGSLRYAVKPDGETSDPFQILVPTNSSGTDFMIVNYGTNFYLWDTVNRQWIKINQAYTPPTAGLLYGFVNWNAGTSDDRFYFGNGTDDTMKWVMGFNQLSIDAVSADTTLTLGNSISFPLQLQVGNPSISIANPSVVTFTSPHHLSVDDQITFDTTGALPTGITAGTTYYVISSGFTTTSFEFSTSQGGSAVVTSGTQSGIQTVYTHTIPIILKNTNGSVINLKYTGNSANVLTLTTSVGSNVPAGSTVTMPIFDMDMMPKGKVFSIFNSDNLILANYAGFENNFSGSIGGNPETFVPVGTTVGDAIIGTLTKGKGGIIGIDNFGEYLIFEKEDIMIQFSLQYSGDGTSFIPLFVPIMNGDGIGPVQQATKVNYMNTLYYTTLKQGIISFSPQTTGSQTTAGLSILSQKIQNYVTQVLDFSNSRSVGFNQKLYWACAQPILQGIQNTANNEILVYDLIRGAWSRFEGWNAVDIKPVNDQLYYLNLNDGGVYQCYVDYQDDQEGNPYEYDVSFTTKRIDLGFPFLLSRPIYVYVQGYITLTTVFYVDVLYNENGTLGKQTYEIDGSNPNIVQNALLGGLASYPFGIPLLGGFNLRTMQSSQNPAFFRCYLELNQSFRPNNIQVRCYSQEIGSYWSVNNLTYLYLPEPSVPTQMVLGPAENPPVVL